MAVNFGILAQTPSIGERYAEGLQLARAEQERNMLRAAQMQQMQAQQQNMLAQQEERRSQAALRSQQELELKARVERAAREEGYLNKVSELFANNSMPLNLQTAQQGLSYAIKSGNRDAVAMMERTVAGLQEREALRSAFGQPAAASAAPAAAAGVNALAAPAPMPSPAAPQAAPIAGGMSPDRLRAIIADPDTPRVAVDRAKALLASMPKEPPPPAPSEVVKLNRELAEAQAAGDTALVANLQARIARLTEKPQPMQVNLPPQEKAFESGLGGAQAKKIMDDQAVAQDARSIIDTVQQGRQLLQSGMITGFGAEFLTQAGAALNQAGINFAEDRVANTQAFAANMAQNVGRIIKQFGAGTGLSDADREYAEKMAGGKVTLDRKAIERILDINERAARNVIALHNKRVEGIKTNVPLTVEMPPGPPAAAPIPGAPAAAAPAAAPAAAAPMYARNPTTGARIMSTDGGRTWSPVR